jgi:hypothetical protein
MYYGITSFWEKWNNLFFLKGAAAMIEKDEGKWTERSAAGNPDIQIAESWPGKSEKMEFNASYAKESKNSLCSRDTLCKINHDRHGVKQFFLRLLLTRKSSSITANVIGSLCFPRV